MDYKTYSLDKLKEWVHDAINSGDVTATEVYNAITSVVEDEIDYHTKNLANLNELNTLLNNNHSEKYDAVVREKEYYEPTMPPWGHSDMEALKYSDEELDAMCDAAEKEKNSKSYKEVKNENDSERIQKISTMNYKEAIASGWAMTDDGFWIPPNKKDKVIKWVLPVEETKNSETNETEYFVRFPDDLLKAADLKEGDQMEWIDNKDGSYNLKKITKEKN